MPKKMTKEGECQEDHQESRETETAGGDTYAAHAIAAAGGFEAPAIDPDDVSGI